MYVQNFIVDFLQRSDKTLYNLFKIKTKLSESRTKPKTFDAKVYHKSKKNRSQVVMKNLDDCNNIQYISKRRKRTFYKKFSLLLSENRKMSWLKKVFSSQSLQETKVAYETSNNEGEKYKKTMILKLANWKLKKRIKKSSQGSDNSWFSSWSGLSTTFCSPESKKKEFSNDDEEEDNGGGLLVARKETKAKAKAFFFFQARTSSQATNTPTQTCVYKDDNKDNNQDDDDDSKVEFFLKVGQHKKIKFFKFLFRKKLIIM